MKEFDVVCAGPERVILVEVKSSPQVHHIKQLKSSAWGVFRFFSEFENLELIMVLASWSILETLCQRLSKAGLYGIAMGDETMAIVARPKPSPAVGW